MTPRPPLSEGRQRRMSGQADPVVKPPRPGHAQQLPMFQVKPTAQHRYPRGYTPEQQEAVRKSNVGEPLPQQTHPGDESVPTKRWSAMSPNDQRVVEEHVRAQTGTTMTKAVARLDRLYMGATPGERQTGHEWYPEAHHVIQSAARHLGRHTRTMAGMVAAMSPNGQWSHPDPRTGNMYPENMARAVRIAQSLKEDPTVEITREHAASIRDNIKRDSRGHIKADKSGQPMKGRSYSKAGPGVSDTLDLENYHGEEHQHHGKSFVGTHRVSELPADVVTALNSHHIGVNWRTMNPVAVKKAVRIYRGEDPGHVLEQDKERSFFNNLNHPYHAGSVTADRHAMRAVTGRGLEGSGEYERLKTIPKREMQQRGASEALIRQGPQNAAYPFVSRAHELAAARHGVSVPNREQAVDWNRQLATVNTGGYTSGKEAKQMQARASATHAKLRSYALGAEHPEEIETAGPSRSKRPAWSRTQPATEQPGLFKDRRKRKTK